MVRISFKSHLMFNVNSTVEQEVIILLLQQMLKKKSRMLHHYLQSQVVSKLPFTTAGVFLSGSVSSELWLEGGGTTARKRFFSLAELVIVKATGV